MVNVNFCFKVDFPVFVNKFTVFDTGKNQEYFDLSKNKFSNFAESCMQANKLMLRLLEKDKNFRISYALSGFTIDVLERNFPELAKSFKELAETGQVEFLAMPYYGNLSYFYSKKEFETQIKMHSDKIYQMFGFSPRFLLTDLGLSSGLIKTAEKLKIKGVIAKDSFHNQNLVYKSNNFIVILANTYLSSCVNQQFSNVKWKEWPLTSEKYSGWINKYGYGADCINLVIDYNSFGIKHPKSSRIFSLFAGLPEEILKNPANVFKTPSELACYAKKKFKIRNGAGGISGSRLQLSALEKIYSFEEGIINADKNTTNIWRTLQHPKIISSLSDADSSYENYIILANILEDLGLRLSNTVRKTQRKTPIKRNNRNEKINKAQIKRINTETPQEIIRGLKEVYKIG